MVNTRSENTYMLFTKTSDNVIEKIVGPVFEHEIERMKAEKFVGIPHVIEVAEEFAFKATHPEAYKRHVYKYWPDKLYCYLFLNANWVGASYSSPQGRGFAGDWFSVTEILDKTDRNRFKLTVHFEYSANKFYVSRLLYDLRKMMPMPVKEGPVFYAAKDGRTYLGDRATSVFLAEELISHACLM